MGKNRVYVLVWGVSGKPALTVFFSRVLDTCLKRVYNVEIWLSPGNPENTWTRGIYKTKKKKKKSKEMNARKFVNVCNPAPFMVTDSGGKVGKNFFFFRSQVSHIYIWLVILGGKKQKKIPQVFSHFRIPPSPNR